MLNAIKKLWRQFRGLDRIEHLETQVRILDIADQLERALMDRLEASLRCELDAAKLAADRAEFENRMLQRKLDGYRDSFRETEDLLPDQLFDTSGVEVTDLDPAELIDISEDAAQAA